MRTIKFLFCLFLFSLVSSNISICVGQASAIVKQTVRATAKQAAKGAAKQTAKGAAKQAAKGAAKQAAKGATKAATKAAIKQEAKTAISNGISTSTKEASRSIVKKQALKTAKGSLTTETMVKAEKRVASRASKKATTTAAKQRAKRVSAAESKALANKAFTRQVSGLKSFGNGRVVSKMAEKKALVSTGATTLKNASSGATMLQVTSRETLKKNIGETTTARWMKLTESHPEMTKTLITDLEKNPSLAKAVGRNPELIDVYHRNFSSPKYRSDVSVLRYQQHGASKFSEDLKFYDKKLKKRVSFSGNQLTLKEENGVNYWVNNETGKKVGVLSGSQGNYTVECYEGNGNMLQNMSLMPNTKYIIKNNSSTQTIFTNKLGQRTKVEFTLDGKQKIKVGKRDASKIQRTQHLMAEQNVYGVKDSRYHNLNDDGGHIIPKSWGGSDDAINLYSQNMHMNRSGGWKKAEISGKKALKKGKKVELSIEFKYPTASLRPSEVHRIQKIDGVVMYDEVLPNIIEYK